MGKIHQKATVINFSDITAKEKIPKCRSTF